MKTLYIVPTPIGNLEDMTLRGIRILNEVSLIAAEDTRHSRKLLNHYNIHTRITSFYEYNKYIKISYIMEVLNSGDVALISDAGTPTISDPGFELVIAAIENGYQVVPLPGPSAITTAISASGLSPKAFTFLGFLQRNHPTKVINQLTQFRNRDETIILYENPTRLIHTLKLLRSILGNRPVVVANDLTKMFEEFHRGHLDEVIDYYQNHPVKGEVTIIVDGQTQREVEIWTEESVKMEFQKAIANGAKRSLAAKEISKTSGWSRQRIYKLLENEEN